MSKIDFQARILRAAQICQQQGITQAEIATAVGASQSQVSRILQGKGIRSSRLCEEICLYIERYSCGVTPDSVRANDDLVDALASTWNGTVAHARALSIVIRSLSGLGSPSVPPQIPKEDANHANTSRNPSE